MVSGHAGIPGNKRTDSLPKARTSLVTAMVPYSSPELLPKLVTPSVINNDVTFSHFSSYPNCLIPTISLSKWFSPTPYALSFPPSLPSSKPLTIVASQSYGNFSSSAGGHLLHNLNHLFLHYLASEPLCKSIFGSAACTLECVSTVGSLRSSDVSSSLRRG